jgi:hypothetical protein
MRGIYVENFGSLEPTVFAEAPGADCFGQGEQILWLYETDIRS